MQSVHEMAFIHLGCFAWVNCFGNMIEKSFFPLCWSLSHSWYKYRCSRSRLGDADKYVCVCVNESSISRSHSLVHRRPKAHVPRYDKSWPYQYMCCRWCVARMAFRARQNVTYGRMLSQLHWRHRVRLCVWNANRERRRWMTIFLCDTCVSHGLCTLTHSFLLIPAQLSWSQPVDSSAETASYRIGRNAS